MPEPLNLAFVASASIHSARWIAFFRDRGHRVSWFLTSSPDGSIPAGSEPLPSANGHSKAWSGVRSVFHLRRALAGLRPDLVHAHYAGVPGVIAALAGHRPFVLSAWGSDVLVAGQKPLLGIPIRWALRTADLVTCDAQHMIDAIARVGVPRDRVTRINFGTDVAQFRPVPRDASIDRRLDLPPGPRVISIRNFHPVYDIGTLIRAMPIVLRDVPDATFILGGRGPEETALKGLAQELGVSDRVRFCGAFKSDELPGLFAAADVYVSTALSDAGLAASTAEAMACEVAVVVTDTGENDTWIDSGRNGFLVPAGDVEALAARLSQLLRDHALRRRFAGMGRVLIVERSNYHVEFGKMEALYLELAARGRCGPSMSASRSRPVVQEKS